MVTLPPSVYILHGEDEFEISQFLSELEAKVGDPAIVALNTTQFDGRSLSLPELRDVISALPLMTPRRLVIVDNPFARLRSDEDRERFKDLLDQIPSSTALVLIEFKTLSDKHFLLSWARSNEGKVYIRSFPLKKSGEMSRWIMDTSKDLSGKFSPQAAALLASLVGEDTGFAYQEINKLLAYTNYQRTVEPEDVDNLTASVGQVNIFTMVDSLGRRDGRQALDMLQNLLKEGDPLSLFGMVIRQFRLLMLAREVMDRGGTGKDVERQLNIHPYVAEKITNQARYFSLVDLESVYRQLMNLDIAIKTGRIDADLALDTFTVGFTTQRS